jgi:hypothetical protein
MKKKCLKVFLYIKTLYSIYKIDIDVIYKNIYIINIDI